MLDKTPVTGAPIVRNIYEKVIFESDNGMTVVRRNVMHGMFTARITQYMGIVSVMMQFPNGQAQQIEREFSFPFTTLEECFANYEATMKAAIPGIQQQLKLEMIEAEKNRQRIIPAGPRLHEKHQR
jgi:hypothetical protein